MAFTLFSFRYCAPKEGFQAYGLSAFLLGRSSP
jgi:hypothetical protein